MSGIDIFYGAREAIRCGEVLQFHLRKFVGRNFLLAVSRAPCRFDEACGQGKRRIISH